MDDEDEDFAPRGSSRRRRRRTTSAGPTTRRMGVMERPETVLEHSYLLPPLGVRPRVAFEKKKPPKADSLPRVEAPGELPIYQNGPLFRQGEGLSELTLPIQQGMPPDWVSLPILTSFILLCFTQFFSLFLSCRFVPPVVNVATSVSGARAATC